MKFIKFTHLATFFLLAPFLIACNRAQLPSTPAVTYPYVLDNVPPLQFELVEDGNEISLTASCVELGNWQAIQLNLSATEFSNNSSIEANDTNQCNGSEGNIFKSSLWQPEQLEQGETVSLDINVTTTDTTGATLTYSFEVGENGQIHPVE